jgi:hypothetical protein
VSPGLRYSAANFGLGILGAALFDERAAAFMVERILHGGTGVDTLSLSMLIPLTPCCI